jgi:hypothetical protein
MPICVHSPSPVHGEHSWSTTGTQTLSTCPGSITSMTPKQPHSVGQSSLHSRVQRPPVPTKMHTSDSHSLLPRHGSPNALPGTASIGMASTVTPASTSATHRSPAPQT